MSKGIWVSQTEFVRFGESRRSLSSEIATRSKSIDFHALGMYLPNPDPVLKQLGQDIKVYRELRADAHVGGCIRRRKASVKAMEWGFDKDKSTSLNADKISKVFDRLKMNRIITEMLDASLYGYQPMEVIWGYVDGWIVPVDIIGKPAEWFRYDDDNKLRLRTKSNPVSGEELPDRKFLVPRQDASYDNPYGQADLSMCFWPTTFKKGGLKFWVQFTEKYGMPWVIGKHPRGTPDSETNKLLDALEEMVQDAVGVIPDDASIDILEPGAKVSSVDVYERLLYYCRSEVAIALLGQNQTTEADANKASATAGLSVTDDIRDGDAAIVSEAMNELIGWMCDMNGVDERPEFELWAQEEVDETLARRDASLYGAGARFKKSYFSKSYGIDENDLDESAIAPAQNSPFGGTMFAEFAEAPEQAKLDNALDDLENGTLNDDMQAILQPLFDRIKSGATPSELLGMLADFYPEMDASGLQERLARVIFVSSIWGKINANRS